MEINKAFFERILKDFLANRKACFLCKIPCFEEIWGFEENRLRLRKIASLYIKEAKYAGLFVDTEDMGRKHALVYVGENDFRAVRIDFLKWCILNPKHYENENI